MSVSAAVTISLTDVDEPPLAPAAPTVTATPNATDSLSVSWSAPSNTGRPAIDSYDLQYREGTTGTWTDGPQNVSGTSTTIAGLAADPAAYQVQVRATNDEGDGPWSPTGRIGGGGGGARNDPPLAVDDAAETVEGTAVFIDVFANDSDPNGDTLTVVELSAPAHGTAVVAAAAAAAGTVEYTPEPDFHGTDRFTYVVGDGSGLTARAAVEVTVLPVNDPPLAVDDAAETVEGTAVFIDVLANDSDPNGDTLTVVEVSAPAHGTAVVAAAGTVEYTPGPDFHGTDRFTYVVGDGSGLTARAAVEVTVLPVDPPLAGDDAADTPEDTSVTIAVLANDSDPKRGHADGGEGMGAGARHGGGGGGGYGGVHAGAGLSRHRPLDVRGGGRIGADGAGGGGGDGAAGERPAAGNGRHPRPDPGCRRRAGGARSDPVLRGPGRRCARLHDRRVGSGRGGEPHRRDVDADRNASGYGDGDGDGTGSRGTHRRRRRSSTTGRRTR